MAIQGYDLVGDVHGHADPLHRLLDKLDYTEVEGVFRHSERKMIFVGDFIDRGPEQREVLRIAVTSLVPINRTARRAVPTWQVRSLGADAFASVAAVYERRSPGSAGVSPVGFGVSPKRTFGSEDCEGETPSHTPALAEHSHR